MQYYNSIKRYYTYVLRIVLLRDDNATIEDDLCRSELETKIAIALCVIGA